LSPRTTCELNVRNCTNRFRRGEKGKMKKIKNVKVTHIIAEFHGCNPELLKETNSVKDILENSVRESKLTKIRSYFHQFQPFGVTGVVLLMESHISIHTWPEYNYAAIDVFGCGDKKKVVKAFELLKEKFQPTTIIKKELRRGV